MKYFVSLDRDCIRIHIRNAEIGYVELPSEAYRVRLPDGELVAVVNSIADTIPAILDHYEQEKRRSGAYNYLPLIR